MAEERELFFVVSMTLTLTANANRFFCQILCLRSEGKKDCQAELVANLNIKEKERTCAIAGSSDDENIYDWIVNIPMTADSCLDYGSAMTKANIRDFSAVQVYFRISELTYTLCTIFQYNREEDREREEEDVRFDDLAFCRRKITVEHQIVKNNKIMNFDNFILSYLIFEVNDSRCIFFVIYIF